MLKNSFHNIYLVTEKDKQCLLKMLEIWKKAADEKRFAGDMLTVLSNAFD